MSKADKLLDGLTEDQIMMYTAAPETESHIVIGADRFIIVPDELKRIAVQHDHNIETVTFDCPRYWDDHDMSEMQIYINYINGDTKGSYIAENVIADGNIMHFDWTIKREVTQYKGPVAFLVCIKKTDADGEEVNHWNSELNRDMYVSEGLETIDVITSAHPDIITQLLTRMDFVEEAAVTFEELEDIKTAVLSAADSIIDAGKYVSEKADEFGNGYSNALKSKASGKIIRLDDVSPAEHTIKGRVTGVENIPDVRPSDVTILRRGKNLIDVADLTVERTIAWGSEHVGDFYLPSGTYTATCDFEQQGAQTHIALSARKYGVAEVTYANVSSDNKSGRLSMTFTVPEGEHGVTLYVYSNVTADVLNTKCVLSNIQIERGAADTGYEPYVDYPYEEAVADGAVPKDDGYFTIRSVSPTMTVYSDMAEEGAVIEIEYNMDTMAYITRNTNAGISWHRGTLITGYGDEIFMPVLGAKPGDFYFNTDTGNIYTATDSGEWWKYVGNMNGGGGNTLSLTDTETGDIYTLSVTNGKLTLTKMEV